MRKWPLGADFNAYMRQSVAPEDRVDEGTETIRPDDTATSRETFLSFKEQQCNADKALKYYNAPHLLENNSPYALQSVWATTLRSRYFKHVCVFAFTWVFVDDRGLVQFTGML